MNNGIVPFYHVLDIRFVSAVIHGIVCHFPDTLKLMKIGRKHLGVFQSLFGQYYPV